MVYVQEREIKREIGQGLHIPCRCCCRLVESWRVGCGCHYSRYEGCVSDGFEVEAIMQVTGSKGKEETVNRQRTIQLRSREPYLLKRLVDRFR